jgi:Asp/Glu/hydantoin racemase
MLGTRIIGVSALSESLAPARAAMAEAWPEASFHNLLDEALVADLASFGGPAPHIAERFLRLAQYAVEGHGDGGATRGLLFTCSAFGPAIQAVKDRLPIPVVAPNEGAFDEALAICGQGGDGARVGLLVTFAGSVEPLAAELARQAADRDEACPEIVTAVAAGALQALQRGCAQAHDRIIAEAAAAMPPTDVLILGQFSMARAAPLVAGRRAEPVLTTPHAAVRRLRRLVEDARRSPAEGA